MKKLIFWGISFPRGLCECLSYLPNLEYLDITDCDLPTKHLADGIVKVLEEATALAPVTYTLDSDPTSISCEKRKDLEEDRKRIRLVFSSLRNF